jgi:hypothetical protein
MNRKPATVLLPMLASLALLAGCGSSSSSSSSTAATTATSTAPTTGVAPTGGAKAGAVAKCRNEVHALPTLPAATKVRLEAICEKAASGDVKAARSAAREGCEAIVRASPVPEGPAKQRALSGCKKAQ